MYYNYHGKIRKLIAEGHLIGYKYMERYNGIAPCLLLIFDNNIPMPVREYRWEEYQKVFDTMNINKID